MINSREKGKRFERNLASLLRDYGYDCRRGQQFSGANGDADVVGLPHIHIEGKHREMWDVYDFLSQAKADAREGELPAVFARKNHCPVVVIMELDDWMKVYREFEASVPEDAPIL